MTIEAAVHYQSNQSCRIRKIRSSQEPRRAPAGQVDCRNEGEAGDWRRNEASRIRHPIKATLRPHVFKACSVYTECTSEAYRDILTVEACVETGVD